MKIAILAGGSGTRLWPRSRIRHPKQFLDLAVPNQSLFQETAERIRPLVSAEDILVVTSRDFVREVARQLPDIPAANILTEPFGRGTAAAIGLAAITIMHRWGNEVMVSLHSDHHIANHDVLRRAIVGAAELARKGYLTTLGIVPTRPHPGLGHVKRGTSLGIVNGFPAYTIERFVEKPVYELAKQYTESGEYYWNTGMFVWQTQILCQEFAAYMPELWAALTRLDAALDTRYEKTTQTWLWKKLAVVQIDPGVMEKTRLGAVVPVENMGWSDLGDWNSLQEIREADEHGNVIIGDSERIDTSDCIIAGTGHRLITTIGLHNMVIVETDDAILVCPRQRAQDVRKLVERLREAKRYQHL